LHRVAETSSSFVFVFIFISVVWQSPFFFLFSYLPLPLFQATINITGKCKGVTVDTCEQVKVLLDGALSSVELVNCKRMQVQIRGKSPTVAIDKTDGCLVRKIFSTKNPIQ